MKSRYLLLFSPLLFSLNACAPVPSYSYDSAYEVNRAYQIQTGTVQHLRRVVIHNSDSGTLGSIAGGVIGGIAGSTVGRGVGRDLASVVGATAGVVLGGGIEQQARQQSGLEITVLLDNGAQILVVQNADPMFQIGERVRVLTGGSGQVRVSR